MRVLLFPVNLRKSANDSISALSTILSAAEIQTWHKGAQLPVNLHLYWESQSDAKVIVTEINKSSCFACIQGTGNTVKSELPRFYEHFLSQQFYHLWALFRQFALPVSCGETWLVWSLILRGLAMVGKQSRYRCAPGIPLPASSLLQPFTLLHRRWGWGGILWN